MYGEALLPVSFASCVNDDQSRCDSRLVWFGLLCEAAACTALLYLDTLLGLIGLCFSIFLIQNTVCVCIYI